jgi:hypothetical protein
MAETEAPRSQTSEAAEPPDHEAAWARHRHNVKWTWLSFVGVFLAMAGLHLLPFGERLAWLPVLAFVVVGGKYASASNRLRCPRCGQLFFIKGRTRVAAPSCRHCGLPNGAWKFLKR